MNILIVCKLLDVFTTYDSCLTSIRLHVVLCALHELNYKKKSGKSKKSYWQAFSYAGDFIHEAFFYLDSVPLESTVADVLELYISKLS